MVKELHILSWGGGTQSTAMMLKMLSDGKKFDYIIFADTKNEPEMVYSQVYKVQKYIKEKYDQEIIITARNKTPISDDEAIKMVKATSDKEYRRSEYADLFQSHILYFKGFAKAIDAMPFWTRDKKTGKIGKTPFKACTTEYKLRQLLREVRKQEGVNHLTRKRYKIYMYVGFSADEIIRLKPSPIANIENVFPLIELNWEKKDCIDYVEKKLGFIPTSSVCNMCFANHIDRIYDIYKNDKKGWGRLLMLDDAMAEKPKDHKIINDCFMFRWQAEENVRLRAIDFEDFYKNYNEKRKSRSLFDLEEEGSCMGGCFL